MAGMATDTATANLEALKRGYEAFQTGNLDALREIMDPNIVWHSPGKSQFAGDYKGVDDVLGLFVRQAQYTNGTFKVEVHDFLASDDHVVAIATLSGERDGRSLSDLYTHVCHFRDGRLAEAWIVEYDVYKADEFFG